MAKEAARTPAPLMAARTLFGCIDPIENAHVVGWAIDTSRADATANLFMFIDDTLVGNFSTHLDRPDVRASGLPGSQAGFRVPIPAKFLDGVRHTFYIRYDSGAVLTFGGAQGSSPAGSFLLLPADHLTGRVDGVRDNCLRGWVILERDGSGVRRGSVDLVVRHNGAVVETIVANKYRPDVGKALDCDPYCGFMYMPPPRFRDGRQFKFELVAATSSEELPNSPVVYEYPAYLPEARLGALKAAVDELSAKLWHLSNDLQGLLTRRVFSLDDYDAWARQYHSAFHRAWTSRPRSSDRPPPLVSILCPVYRPRLSDFRAAVESVIRQTYTNWELILVDDQSLDPDLTQSLYAFAASEKRIRLIELPDNVGISGATNVAIAAARGDFVALFDHDDLLVDSAVDVAMHVASMTDAQIIYSDEDKIDEFGRYSEPNFKGSWNYRLMLAQNYVCHFLVVNAVVLKSVGPLRKKYDGAQDHDLLLRLSEIVDPRRIVHVAEVLYHWRKTPGSTADTISAKSYAPKAGALAITDHLKRRGLSARPSSILGAACYDIDWRFTAEPRVTIVIPFKEHVAMTELCLTTLISVTAYANFNIILVDNWSYSDEAKAFCRRAGAVERVTILRVEEPFNYSRLNNLACARSDAAFFVFMNNDVVVESPLWLRKMVDEALADRTVAIVGAKLLYPDRTIQHAGVILGVGGIGDHANRGRGFDDPFYVGRGVCAQELSAVTAALMLCNATAFRSTGGFDEESLTVAYNDVDLCLKVREAGYAVVYCPSVIAVHHESISRGSDMDSAHMGRFLHEEGVMLERWGPVVRSDPYYNPNFSPDSGIFEQLANPDRSTSTGDLVRFRRGSSRISVSSPFSASATVPEEPRNHIASKKLTRRALARPH